MREQSGLGKRPCIATFFVLALLAGCSNTKEEPAAYVPADCRQFLDKYFEAWKSKDVATLQTVSYDLSPEEKSRLPEASVEMWRQSKNRLVMQNFEQITKQFGDFKGYEVLRVKTTTIPPQDQPAANMMGSGIRTELVCKTNFSRKYHAHAWLQLMKETEASQYFVAAWNFEAEP